MGNHQTLPLPIPNKRSLAVTVEHQVFVNNPNILPPRYTKYKDFPKGLLSKNYNMKFGDYVFTTQGPNDNGDIVLLFAPPISEEESNTPYETSTRFGNHYWPPILKSLKFIEDRSMPHVTRGPNGQLIFGKRYYVRETFIPSVSEGTLFVIKKFISATEPEIPQHEVPVPTRVSWDTLGVSGSFQECLHPKIVIPALQTGFATFTVGDSSSGATYGSAGAQVFPATNFTDWSEYVISDKAELNNGVWEREQVTVYPPAEPETIIR